MRKKIIDSSKKTIEYIRKELERGRNAKDLAKEFNVSPSTFYSYISEHKITYYLKYPRGVSEELALKVVEYVKENPHKSNQAIQDEFLISYYQLRHILEIHGLQKQQLKVKEVRWTPAQQRILRVYQNESCKTYAEIARKLGTTRMSVGRVVKKYNELRGLHGDS